MKHLEHIGHTGEFIISRYRPIPTISYFLGKKTAKKLHTCADDMEK